MLSSGIYVNREVGRSCRSSTRRCSKRPAPRPTTGCMAKYDAREPGGAAAPGGRRRAAAAVLARDHAGLLQGRRSRCTTRSPPRTRSSRRSMNAWKAFREDQYLWFRVAENTFENFVYTPERRREAARARAEAATADAVGWLRVSGAIDRVNELLGRLAECAGAAVPACVSAGNAMVRYAYDYSSNAWLEVQWYMFAAMVMFGASYTLQAQRACAGGDLLPLSHRARPALARPDRRRRLPARRLCCCSPGCPGRSSCSPTR